MWMAFMVLLYFLLIFCDVIVVFLPSLKVNESESVILKVKSQKNHLKGLHMNLCFIFSGGHIPSFYDFAFRTKILDYSSLPTFVPPSFVL